MPSYTLQITLSMADQAALDGVVTNLRAAYAQFFPQYAVDANGANDALHTLERAEPRRMLDILRDYTHQQAMNAASAQQAAVFQQQLAQTTITTQVVAA